MNVIKLPASVSSLTNLLLRALPLRRGKETSRTVGRLGRNAAAGTATRCGCRTVTPVTSCFVESHDQENAKVVLFSVHSDHHSKGTGYFKGRRVFPFSLFWQKAACVVEVSPLPPPHPLSGSRQFHTPPPQPLSGSRQFHTPPPQPLSGSRQFHTPLPPPHPLRQFHPPLPPPQPLGGSRQFHTVSGRHASFTSPRLQRGSRGQQEGGGEGVGRPRKKRLPLSRSQEIEEVLEEHADTIADFAAALGVSYSAMGDMVRRDTRLLTQFHKEAVMAKMRLLLDHGFPPGEILSRYQVFSRSLSHLESGLRSMEATRHYRHRLATLLLSPADFEARMAAHRREVAVMGDHSSQASFVAELLECTPDEVSALADRHEFLLTLAPSRLREAVTVLLSFGLTIADIRSKCLMLRCPPELARQRLQRVSEAGVLDRQLVPYILTNSDAHFEASFASWTRNAEALGTHADERALLMHTLGCSEEEVCALMRRKRRVATMKSAKLQQCLQVLQQEVGLSSQTILRQGELLYFSPQRLRSRWALLQPLGLSQTQIARDLILTEKKFVAKYGHGSD